MLYIVALAGMTNAVLDVIYIPTGIYFPETVIVFVISETHKLLYISFNLYHLPSQDM